VVNALVNELLESHMEHNQRILECSPEGKHIYVGEHFGLEKRSLISPRCFLDFFKSALE